MPVFQPERIFQSLNRHRVDYVVIGGIAATLHGSNLSTGDVDICPARDPGNNDRLAVALRELGARIRVAGIPDGLPFNCDADFLGRMDLLNLTTLYGDFDISFVPSGTTGYADLARRAVKVALDPVFVQVASLEDVIRSKKAAGRPKDLAALPALETLLEEIRRHNP